MARPEATDTPPTLRRPVPSLALRVRRNSGPVGLLSTSDRRAGSEGMAGSCLLTRANRTNRVHKKRCLIDKRTQEDHYCSVKCIYCLFVWGRKRKEEEGCIVYIRKSCIIFSCSELVSFYTTCSTSLRISFQVSLQAQGKKHSKYESRYYGELHQCKFREKNLNRHKILYGNP